ELAPVRPALSPVARDAEGEARMAGRLEDDGVKVTTPLVVLNPGPGGDHKRWAVEAFRRLGAELAVRLGGRVGITWGPGEEPLARAIAHGMRTGALVPPATTLIEMIALFRRATPVVGRGTGPAPAAAGRGGPPAPP